MSLTGKDIAEIAKLLDASQFTSLDLQQGDFRLRIRRDGASEDDGYDADEDDWQPARRRRRRVVDEADDEPGEDEPAPTPPPPPAPGQAAPAAGEVDVIAPLLGNFYSAPRPGEDPFVAVGDTIGEDTIVGIIEVMKLMNSVRAGVAGTVTAVLAENGSAVEQDQPLFRVKVE